VSGKVVLVGAGPGDPDLLTLRLARIPERCERIDVGKRGDGSRGVAQDRIAALMIEQARSGRHVVRLKGGDPFVFGRGGEEASELARAGIPFEVVPGISSVIAVPAYAGIPVTDRRLSSSIAVVTGHRGKEPVDRRVDWEGLARSAETLVILMGTTWLEDIVRRVIDGGVPGERPAAVIASGTTPWQRVVTAPLAELPARVREAGLRAPTVIVIGEVTRFRDTLAWFEARPLFGRRVLVVREREQGRPLVEALRQRGAWPIHVPLLAFRPPEDRAPIEAAQSRLEEYDWIVFTSANAARFFGAEAAHARRTPRVACIGAATAAAAREAGLPADLAPPQRSLPEELARALAAEAPLSGSRILFPCAEQARDALPRALQKAGAQVDRVVVYRTVLPEEAGAELGKAVDAGLDAVALTSPSSVDHLFELLGEVAGRALHGRALFACIGPTTAGALRERGLEAHVVAPRQSGEDLVDALARHFQEGSHGVP
jgi:uroporphyrinogen III methyltransferase/synthase